jgi:hypothetical protein
LEKGKNEELQANAVGQHWIKLKNSATISTFGGVPPATISSFKMYLRICQSVPTSAQPSILSSTSFLLETFVHSPAVWQTKFDVLR